MSSFPTPLSPRIKTGALRDASLRTFPATHRISFKTTESQLQDLEGYYQLEASPDGAKTRVTYESKGRDKVALPFPQSVVDSANRELFVNTMRGAKKSAQQAGG